MNLKKVTLNTVNAKIKKGGWAGHICPSKCYPNYGQPFNMAIWVNWKSAKSMENQLNNYIYYNCTPETGKSVHFYEEFE